MAETKKKLPENEWRFKKLPPALVSYAFFYEYARQSHKIKALVDEYRKLTSHGIEYHDVWSDWAMDSKKSGNLPKEKTKVLWQKTEQFKVNDYLPLIRWLAHCKKFPKTPFLELKSEDYRNGPEVSVNERVFPVNGRGVCEMGYCWMKDFSDKTFQISLTPRLGSFQPIATGPDGEEHVTAHMLRVDWWKTDSELKQEFAEWVDVYRKFLKVKSIPPGKRGLLNQPLDLPKECRKMGTALAHLGNLRCLEAAGSWENYLDIYEKIDRRYLERDVSAARAVLAWLESKV
jgi:hypothetical protein